MAIGGKVMGCRAASVLLALSLSVAAVSAAAQGAGKASAEPELTGALKRIKDSGVLNVGYAESPMPLSYFDRYKNIIGYSIDICKKVTDAVKTEIKKPDLKVEMKPIKVEDAASYISSGVIDLHCGPVLNTWQRKSQVEFGMTYYVQRYRFASHESAHMDEISDMQNKSIATIYGPAVNALQALVAAHDYKLTTLPARTPDEAFRALREGGAHAVFLDEITLAYGVAKSIPLDPAMIIISNGTLGAEPYSLVYLKGDKPFKELVVGTMRKLYATGGIDAIYQKWFGSKIPPEGIDLNLRPSESLQKIFRQPTDSPDPAAYE